MIVSLFAAFTFLSVFPALLGYSLPASIMNTNVAMMPAAVPAPLQSAYP
jgi:hypothetical protein